MQEEVTTLKNKIKKFSKGDFQAQQPEIVFSDTCLILTIGEGEVFRGSFTIKCLLPQTCVIQMKMQEKL